MTPKESEELAKKLAIEYIKKFDTNNDGVLTKDEA